MRARRNAGMTEQRLARAPQKARVARRTSRLRVGSQGGTPTHTSSIIRPSASTTARQTAAPQHTVKRRRPASAPSPASNYSGPTRRRRTTTTWGERVGWAQSRAGRESARFGSGTEDMGPDLVLGHAHQACCDGHLLLRISRKVLRSGNGLLDRGRLITHPWWTGELGRLGLGANTRGHDQTIPDHVVFVQRNKSRAGLRHGRNPARSGP